jgi:hypothetical protein
LRLYLIIVEIVDAIELTCILIGLSFFTKGNLPRLRNERRPSRPLGKTTNDALRRYQKHHGWVRCI